MADALDGGPGIDRRTSSDMLLDESETERIGQLKRSLSAYRGHLTRLYKEIELLFPNFESHMEALQRKSTLDGLFARYDAKAKELLSKVTDPDEHKRALQDHTRELELKGLFDDEFELWFKRSCEVPVAVSATNNPICEDQPHLYSPRETSREKSSEHPREATWTTRRGSREVPRGPASQNPRKNSRDMFQDDQSTFSTRSFTEESRDSSRISKTSQSAKAKLAMARLHVKKVEEEQRLLGRQQQLEHDKQRLLMERELCKAKFEAEQAQIEMDSSVASGDFGHVFESLCQLPTRTSHEAVGKYIQSFEDGPCSHGQTPLSSSGF